MIQFAKEPLTDALWAEAMPLLEAHWSEVAHFQDIPLNPDRDLYAASEEAGILRCFTARADTTIRSGPLPTFERKLLNVGQVPVIGTYVHPGDLLGYALYFVRPAPHYQSSIQAVQDVLYLAPAHRGRTALKFIDWLDVQLYTEGVQVTYHHIKTALPNAHRALVHLGYEAVDTIYAKRLDSHVSPSKDLSTEPEMGQDWRDQAQHDYDTARFVGIKP